MQSESTSLFEKYLRGDSVEQGDLTEITPSCQEEEILQEEKNKDYDPFSLIEKTISSNFDSSIFEIIDDSDLPLAQNWLDFCINSKFLNFIPYPKQIKFGLEFFADYCPNCSDPQILTELFDQPLQEILDRIQLLHYGECPKCHQNRLEFAKEGKLRLYNELAGCAGQRSGKAQPLYSLIKIPNGWIKMGDIKVGDIVSTPDGKSSPIIGVFPQGKKPIYRITFEDGRFADCGEEHLWKVYNSHWKTTDTRVKGGGKGYIYHEHNPWRIMTTREILDRKNKNPLFIPLTSYGGIEQNFSIDPYVLGLLLGDGSFMTSSLIFSNIDSENLKNLKNKLIEGYDLKKVSETSCDYLITHGKKGVINYYKETLKNLNLWGKQSYEKFIPEIYKEASIKQRLELLRGLMDTDGAGGKVDVSNFEYKVKRAGSTPCFGTSSHQLALDVQYLTRSLGALCKITTKHPTYTYKGVKKQGRAAYRCWIRHPHPKTLYELSRKIENVKRNKQITLGCKIKSIEYLGMEKTQCIMIDHPDHLYITDNFVATHNSVFVAMTACYQLHRFLKIQSPSRYFKLMPNQTMHMVFVALTYKQASDTLWQPFRDLYDSSPWFKEYHQLLDHYGEKLSTKLYEKQKTYLWYDTKRLTIYASGPDKSKLRGRTQFFSSVDELGWFLGDENAIKLNPDEICTALENALQTIRSATELKRKVLNDYNAPDALFVNISSPSAANDKIMRLVREKSPTRYCFHLPTWEMNPCITRDSLESKYIVDPMKAERDFGANPPLSDKPFLSNPDVVEGSIIVKFKNAAYYQTKLETDTLGHTTIKIHKFKMAESLVTNVNHIIGIDTGRSKNAFAVVVQHYDLEIKSCVIDGIIEIRPLENVAVHFPSMYENVIKPIIQTRPVALVVFDKWQSINFEDELHDMKIEAIRYSLKGDDFNTIRGMLLSNKIIIPKTEITFDQIKDPAQDYETLIKNRPVSHLVYQLLTVRDLGNTITKGLGTDDDIFRAWCLGVRYLIDAKWQKIFQKGARRKNKKSIGIMFGKSGGSIAIGGIISGNSGPLGIVGGRSKR
jgi:intein/homing endonuclease